MILVVDILRHRRMVAGFFSSNLVVLTTGWSMYLLLAAGSSDWWSSVSLRMGLVQGLTIDIDSFYPGTVLLFLVLHLKGKSVSDDR